MAKQCSICYSKLGQEFYSDGTCHTCGQKYDCDKCYSIILTDSQFGALRRHREQSNKSATTLYWEKNTPPAISVLRRVKDICVTYRHYPFFTISVGLQPRKYYRDVLKLVKEKFPEPEFKVK